MAPTTGFSWVDYILLAVFFISVLSGLMRGGVKEVVSLLSWIAAFIIAGLFSKPLAAYFSSSSSVQSAISSASSTSTFGISTANQVSIFAISASFSALFIGTIIIGSLIGYFINQAVEGGGISIGNRLLGAIFGLVRGYLIALVLIFIGQFTPIAQQTAWTQSSLVTSFQPAVQWFGNIVQPGLDSLKSSVGQTIQNMTNGSQNSVMGVYQGSQ
jgi:membrane protein required for colicin V production